MAFDNIKLEKGLYASSKGFTKSLQELDPDENYKGTPLENLDAFQRQLKRFDIKVSGAQSDIVDKFFSTSDSAALFPEYISRAVRQGMEEADVLSSIVATTTHIDSLDYRSITSVPTEDDKELKNVAEGAVIPETSITTHENLVTLRKRGRMLVASYEAVKFQKLDLFTVMLKQIGNYIARSQLKDAITVLKDGDGNNNAAEVINAAESGKLTYADLISFWNEFSPYDLSTIIVSKQMTQKLLNLPEFKDAAAGLNFHGTGKMITPLGANLIKSAYAPESQIIGLDKTCALEFVEAGGIVTEYDKLIDRQLERAAITCISGFSKIFTDASKVLSV